jgi:hypothetical protein
MWIIVGVENFSLSRKEMSQDEIANLFAQELNNLKEENRQ